MKGLLRISLIAIALSIVSAESTNAGLLSSFSSDSVHVDGNGDFVVTAGSSFTVDILIESDGSGPDTVRYFDFTVNIVDQSGTPGGISFAATQPGINTESNYLLANGGSNQGNQSTPIESLSSSSIRLRDGVDPNTGSITIDSGDSPRLLARLNVNIAADVDNPSAFNFELVGNTSTRADASNDPDYGFLDQFTGGPTFFTGIGTDAGDAAQTVALGGDFVQGVVAVPEPSSFLAICGLGIATIGIRRKRSIV